VTIVGGEAALRTYRNDVEVESMFIDGGPLTTGKPGIIGSDGGANIYGDDWEGGNITSGGTTLALSGSALTGGSGTGSPGHSIAL
jgi:hypothetical protein